jgi:hypothetical protein
MPIGRNELRPYMMFDRLPDYFVNDHYRVLCGVRDAINRVSTLQGHRFARPCSHRAKILRTP